MKTADVEAIYVREQELRRILYDSPEDQRRAVQGYLRGRSGSAFAAEMLGLDSEGETYWTSILASVFRTREALPTGSLGLKWSRIVYRDGPNPVKPSDIGRLNRLLMSKGAATVARLAWQVSRIDRGLAVPDLGAIVLTADRSRAGAGEDIRRSVAREFYQGRFKQVA